MNYKIGDKVTLTNGNTMTIDQIDDISKWYRMREDPWNYYTDEMIEGLAEDTITTNEQPFKPSNISLEKEMEWNLPEDYIFKDENGNVINTQKIIMEKKKNEYPKTYKECCKILGCKADHFFTDFSYKGCDVEISDYENKIDDLLQNFRKLRYCRDAYWKIAGDEMGLGKPWEPDWKNKDEKKWVISRYGGELDFGFNIKPFRIFAFPTKEMQDSFYENFKELINSCKELL